MDLSKLPKFSQTPPPAQAPAGESRPDAPRVLDYSQTALSSGPEAWLSIVVGLFLLFMYPRFLVWLSHRLFGTNFNEFELNGRVVPYTQVPEFWMDLGPVLFGIVLLMDGLVILFGRRAGFLAVALTLTVLATAYNIIYVFATLKDGFAPISFLAGAFGVYICLYQWKLLNALRGRQAPMT
jgi:hypothetical protein